MKIKGRDLLLATAVYADIFSYPLTIEELWFWFIGKKISSKYLKKIVNKDHRLRQERNYFSLSSNTGSLIAKRIKKQNISKEKWKIARKISNVFHIIPSIRLVGVTGSLAVSMAESSSDIDMIIITASGTLWTTRICTLFLLTILGVRRSYSSKNIKNKICLNMFMDENFLAIPKNERNLFTAHELLQMKPIIERGVIYQKFLLNNRWVSNFLPNAWSKIPKKNPNSRNNFIIFSFFQYLFIQIMRFTEPLVYRIQILYMRKHQTNEVITQKYVRFHPMNMSMIVWKLFSKGFGKQNFALDKIFFGPYNSTHLN